MLSPALSGSVVTPVAPMAGIDRAVVLAARERYRFDIAEGTRSAALEVDGLVVGEVATGAQIDIRLRKDAGSVVRLDAERHGRNGRVKLSLLDLRSARTSSSSSSRRTCARSSARDRGLAQATTGRDRWPRTAKWPAQAVPGRAVPSPHRPAFPQDDPVPRADAHAPAEAC